MGIKAVLAKSMERIHKANLINFGILPLNFKDEKDYDSIDQADELEISNIKEAFISGKNIVVKNISKKTEFGATYDLSDRQKEILLAGGTLSFIKKTQINI